MHPYIHNISYSFSCKTALMYAESELVENINFNILKKYSLLLLSS